MDQENSQDEAQSKPFNPTGPSSEDILKMLEE